MDVAREYLFSKSDFEDRNFSSGDLTRLTKFYVYKKPLLKAFIASRMANPQTHAFAGHLT